MPDFLLSRRALHRLGLAASMVVVMSLVVLGTAGGASAAAYRTWTLSGVTYADGGQASGSFRVSDTGRVDQVDITTSGGDTGVYGATTSYDDTNSDTFHHSEFVYVNFIDRSRYLRFDVGDLTNATDGEVRSINTTGDQSYECINCSPYRVVTAGSVIAGMQIDTSPVTTTGTPSISGTPQVGQILTGDDSTMTTSPSDATRNYQWLRNGSPIAGQTETTYTATTDDVDSALSFQVVAVKTGRPDSTPVESAATAPIQAQPSTPAEPVTVTVPSRLHLGGRPVRVTATGLEADQPYTVTIGDQTVGTGTAPASGALTRAFTVPTDIGDRSTDVRVSGPHGVGTASLRVVQAKRLGLTLTPSKLHKRQRLSVTVTGLTAGERVSVKYRNRVVSPSTAHANKTGSYRHVIRVGRLAGVKTIRVTGAFRGRSAVQTCRVTRR